MPKPIWLLDVDGVINAIPAKRGSSPDMNVWPYENGTAAADGFGWPIWYSPEVMTYINHVVANDQVDVMWLTTWEEEANGYLRELLGLPVLPLAGIRDNTGDYWWKWYIATDLYRSTGRPIIWTDDEIPYRPEASNWVKSIAKDGRILAIGPNQATGITPRHLRKIQEFVDKHAEVPA